MLAAFVLAQFLWFRRFSTAPIPLSLSILAYYFPLVAWPFYSTATILVVAPCMHAHPPDPAIIVVVYTVAQTCICAMYLNYILSSNTPPNLIPPPPPCCACLLSLPLAS